MQSPFLHRGFTLIELLMVVGIISILATIVFRAVKPGQIVIGTNDVQRAAYAREIVKTLNHYSIAHDYLPVTVPTGEENQLPICTQGVTTDSTCINLDFIANENYLPLDRDNAEPNANYLGYNLYYDPIDSYVVRPNNAGAITAVGLPNNKQQRSKFVQNAVATWGNAGFFSSSALEADGYIEFSVPSLQYVYAVGLSAVNTNAHYTSIQYAAYINSNQLLIYENGALRTTVGAIAQNDTIRINRGTGTGTVTYLVNGVVRYTSTGGSTATLYTDAAILTDGTQVSPITLGIDGTTQLAIVTDIIGGKLVPITGCAVAQTLAFTTRKTSIDSWTNSGFASCEQLTATGQISTTVANVSSQYVIGLSSENRDANFTSIQYGMYVNNSALTIYETGVSRGSFGTVAANDTLTIARSGTTITYYKNDVLLYTSLVPTSSALMVDVSIYKQSSLVRPITMTQNSITTNITIIDDFGTEYTQ